MPSASRSIWLIGPAHCRLTVDNADLVLAELPYFLGGWPIEWAGEDSPADADIAIRQAPGGRYEIAGPGAGIETYADTFDAANGLAGALISGLITRDPDLVCAHAGAAEIGGGLALLLGGSFAGKSSVALHLAAAGHRLYGDDRIAVRVPTGRGICLGLMPKVRLPLPDDAGPRFREFIEAYTELEGGGNAYLKPWSAEAARFGDEADSAGLVILDRAAGASTTLRRASASELVRTLVGNVHAPHLASDDLLRQLAALAGSVPGYRLTFESSRLAAERLASLFSGRGSTDD